MCSDCLASDVCGGQRTAQACREPDAEPYPGGPNLLHPYSSEFAEWVRREGLAFDDIHAQHVDVPQLPLYLPQIENSKALAGQLNDCAYALRPSHVVRQDRIVSAAEIRERLGLDKTQALVLLLFDADELLEELFDPRMILRIAGAGYDLVAAPSYSAWVPRPRPELLVNARRSLAYYQALLDAGVPAIPRFLWEIEHDVDRVAAWINDNPTATTVALDFQTYRSSRDWSHQMEGLAQFDSATGRHLSYLINGPTTAGRFATLLAIIEPKRLRITNSTTQIALRSSRTAPRGLPLPIERSRRFIVQVAQQRRLLARAQARPLTVSSTDATRSARLTTAVSASA
jgi:hypothetical protein